MTGECCYWYTQFPATATCNRNTLSTTLTLSCDVQYLLSDNTTNVEVKWYRSKSERSAGIEGERLNHTHITGPVTVNNIGTIIQYDLEISRSTSDQGYYWCQMIVNNDPLPPSPFGFINSSHCILSEVTCDFRNQPLCAQNISRFMAHKEHGGVNCLIEAVIDGRVTTGSVHTTLSNSNDNLFVIGISLGIVIILSLLLIVVLFSTTCVLLFLYNKRKHQGNPCAVR